MQSSPFLLASLFCASFFPSLLRTRSLSQSVCNRPIKAMAKRERDGEKRRDTKKFDFRYDNSGTIVQPISTCAGKRREETLLLVLVYTHKFNRRRRQERESIEQQSDSTLTSSIANYGQLANPIKHPISNPVATVNH